MFNYFTLDDFEFSGRVVGVRVDLNSPLINGKVADNPRIKSHLKTIKELKEKGAKVVILAHQSRPGKKDFISLKEHYLLLKKKISDIKFIDEVYSSRVVKEIKSLKSGEVLLLENLRFIPDEMDPYRRGNKIEKLAKLFDYYVLDAFSMSHRNHSSIVSIRNIPVIAGRVMEEELKGLSRVENPDRPLVYFFGGAKPDDLILLMEVGLKENKVDLILASGVIGEILLLIEGYNIGKKKDFLREKGYLNSFKRLKKIYGEYKNNIMIPRDVALYNGSKRVEIPVDELNNSDLVNEFLIQDIGKRTCEIYGQYIKAAASVYFKGPPGNFEMKPFEFGTQEILKKFKESKAFKFVGGGHSLTAVELFGARDAFDYVSLAGGALVHFLAEGTLVGLEVLEESFRKFEKKNSDFLVVGSNTLDFRVKTGISYKDVHLGDKIKVNENFEVDLGGGGTNVAVAISRLGGKVDYLGKLSEENRDFVFKELTKNKVYIVESKISKKPAAKSIILDFEEDRIIYTYRGQNCFLRFDDFVLKRYKYVYFSSLTGESFQTIKKIAVELKKKGAVICFNPGIYQIKEEKVSGLLKFVDVLVLNFEEARELTRETTIKDCFKALSKTVDCVVITDGSHGVHAFYKDKEYFMRAKKVNAVDTTGAGDSFAATFFFFFVKGLAIEKCLKFGVVNSASVVSHRGAKSGLLYYDDLIKVLEE